MLAALVALLALTLPGAGPSPAGLPPDVAVIRDSGSTNAEGYDLAVQRSGAVSVYVAHAPVMHAKVRKALAARLYADLNRAGALSALPSAACMKSASFGSRLTIAYRGAESPDLTCAENAELRALDADANAIVNAARIVTRVRPARTTPLIRQSDSPTPSPVPSAT